MQICGNGVAAPGIPTCLPYLKGYGQLTYTWRDGTFAALGADYEGRNNAYFQPPFTQVDFTLRRPVSKNVELHVGVQNLLNTNNFGTYLATPGAGYADRRGLGRRGRERGADLVHPDPDLRAAADHPAANTIPLRPLSA